MEKQEMNKSLAIALLDFLSTTLADSPVAKARKVVCQQRTATPDTPLLLENNTMAETRL